MLSPGVVLNLIDWRHEKQKAPERHLVSLRKYNVFLSLCLKCFIGFHLMHHLAFSSCILCEMRWCVVGTWTHELASGPLSHSTLADPYFLFWTQSSALGALCVSPDSSFVTDSRCNLGKGTYPYCASVKVLPWVIGLIETYFTNGCEDNIRFHNTHKQNIVTSIGIMRRCVVQRDLDDPVQLFCCKTTLSKHTSSG